MLYLREKRTISDRLGILRSTMISAFQIHPTEPPLPQSHHPSQDTPRTRVVFAAGSGDVAQTLNFWASDEPDTRIMALPYSAQIYTLAQSRGWRLFCFPNNPCDQTRARQTAVIPLPKRSKRGIKYYLEEFRYGFMLGRIAKRLDAQLMIVATGMHPLGHLAASLSGIPIIVSLHNTLWIRGESPPTGLGGLLLKYASRMLRKRIKRVVAVSDEIRNQVLAYWRLADDQVSVHVPQYDISTMPCTSPDVGEPRRVLFAGRVQRFKGIDDILRAARELENEQPGAFEWVFAGDGPSLESHKSLAAQLGLEHITSFLGQIDRDALIDEVQRCFLTITPTRSSFREGLAKLPLEGAIMGRPGIISTTVPALDLLDEAAESIRPSDPGDIARAVRTLSADAELYQKRCDACRRVREMTINADLGFQARITAAADAILNNQ